MVEIRKRQRFYVNLMRVNHMIYLERNPMESVKLSTNDDNSYWLGAGLHGKKITNNSI